MLGAPRDEARPFNGQTCGRVAGSVLVEYASSHVSNIIAFSGIIDCDMCSAFEQFLYFVMLHVFAGLDTAKKNQETPKEPGETALDVTMMLPSGNFA